MLKRIRFASRAAPPSEFAIRWRDASATVLAAPTSVRPLRVAVCTVLPDITPDDLHDGLALEWYQDADHLARFEGWLGSPDGKVVDDALAAVVDGGGSPLVIAEELVMRGADWLQQRWRDGGEKLKHMAIARRAPGLTPAEFSALWKTRAGKVGKAAIPDAARGHAYVQNHPVPRVEGSWAYDALNEVYFDDLDGVRKRMDFFAASPSEDDLVGENWFVVAREEVIECPA